MKSYHRILASIIVGLALSSDLTMGQVFEPRNKIKLRVKAEVLRQNSNSFSYRYALLSLPESEQKVWEFRIIFFFQEGEISHVNSPSRWRKPMMRLNGPPFWVSWGVFGENKLKPGDSQGGLELETNVKPGITDYYAEGYAPPPSYEGYVSDDTLHGYDDLTPYGPGVVGRTVGPVLPPDPFDPMVFLDTLLSYTAQSKALGWIVSEIAAAKYAGYFTSAKTYLHSANFGAARQVLKQVLQDANADSTSVITSEAYALLRYDTEYLLSKLPAPPEITALTPSMTIAGSGAFTLTVSGNNFEEGSKVNWSGSVRTTTYVADTALLASILAADVAAIGSPIVTVRNPDGNESDGIKFYVVSTIGWVDTLIAYKHRAFDRGWIDDAGVANSLDQKLENARKQLEQGNSKAAKNILAAFVNELEAQRGKHVTNDAYAILKNIVDLLIRRLS